MKTYLFAFFALLAFMGCQRSEQLTLKSDQEQLVSHPGKELMETYCNACHKPQGDHEGRLAPPMAMVKQHYMTDNITKEEFIKNVTNWVDDPNWDHLKMNGAARRFGIMPKQALPKEDIEQIAEYLFDHEFNLGEDCGDHQRLRKRGRKSNNKS